MTQLHVHTGDSSAEQHRRADPETQVMVWCDVLHEGPLPTGAAAVWRAARAECLSQLTGRARSPSQCLRMLEAQDRQLATWPEYAEVVLWHDGCMYDQLLLARHLDWFAGLDLGATTLSLIVCAEYPGRPDYAGLGELTGEELLALLPGRIAAIPAHFDLGRAAWAALTGADPRALAAAGGLDWSLLPWLGRALARYLEQYPAPGTGLHRLEQLALAALASGPRSLGDLFDQLSAQDTPPFFGDTTLWAMLDDLAHGPRPLVAIEDGQPLPRWEPPRDTPARIVALTADGARVLRGELDAAAIRPGERWLGGVHLAGPRPAWRYDRQHRCLLPGA
jgi:hypothetical protein